MKICGIYLIRNRLNGKGYVGQSRNVMKRWRQHRRCNPYGVVSLLYRAMEKHGVEAFDFILLQTAPPADLNTRESFWIEKLQTFGERGYNLTSGGGQGYDISDEVRQRMSLAHTGRVKSAETRRKLSLAKIGIPRSEETKRKVSLGLKGNVIPPEVRRKMSLAHKGRPRTESQLASMLLSNRVNKSKPVRCLTTQQVHRNLHEASIWASPRSSPTGRNKISRVCKGLLDEAYGHKWEYVDKKDLTLLTNHVSITPRIEVPVNSSDSSR